jgi:hypothetical protein
MHPATFKFYAMRQPLRGRTYKMPILLWLLGVPIPIIILLLLLWH